jgi:C-terminal processing protease CtpA/Prc
MVAGAPARSSGKIDQGDVILAVNGQQATNDNIAQLIHGDDLPGSQLALRLQQRNGGHPRDVVLTKMSAGRAVSLKALHDLLVSLRIHLRRQGDSAGEGIGDAISETWANVAQEWYAFEHAAARKVSALQTENSLRLEQVKTSLAEISLGLSDGNSKTKSLQTLCDRDANQLNECSRKLTNAHEELVTASNSMQELRSQLIDQQDRSERILAEMREARDRSLAEEREGNKRVLAEEREAALQEQRRAGQMMEQLREALTSLRREHHGKKEECARSQDQLDRLIAIQGRNDSLVATLQGKISALEKDGTPKWTAGIGVVCDPFEDGLKIRSLVPGGAAGEQGILKPDDIILTVDGTKFRDAEHALGLVQGIEGSSIVVEARRPSTSEVIRTALIRKWTPKPSEEAPQDLREVSRARAPSPAVPLHRSPTPTVAVARPVQVNLQLF